MMKVLSVVGARPQFIKSAAFSHAALGNVYVDDIILHTGQHYDENMSKIFFDQMNLPKPKHQLSVQGRTHSQMTAEMLLGIEEVCLSDRPDFLLVYGDTNSTLAGALVASKLHIPLVHVESGLRSFNKKMPEEINRIITDHCSDILFTPSLLATKNLISEGISEEKIKFVGDVMYDSYLLFSDMASKSNILSKLDIAEKKYALLTMHRAENIDTPSVFSCRINQINAIAKNLIIIFPAHPRVRKMLEKNRHIKLHENVILTDPLGFLDVIKLQHGAQFFLTDSGGMQKEAYFAKKPCVVLREQTEWVELLDENAAILCSPHDEINNVYENLIEGSPKFSAQLYGAGFAAKKVVDYLGSV